MIKIFPLLLCLCISTSSLAKKTSDKKGVTLPKTFYQLEWQDKMTLRYYGSINEDNVGFIIEAINNNSQINKLVITSSGGEVTSNIKLAIILKQKKIAIEVVDYCLSSCFNYLFLAAPHRAIRPNSIIGFHGILTTSIPFVARALKSVRKAVKEEKVFYKSIGMTIKTWKKFHKKVNKIADPAGASMYVVTQKFFDENNFTIDSPWFPQSQEQLNLILEEINNKIIKRTKKPHKMWKMIGDFN